MYVWMYTQSAIRAILARNAEYILAYQIRRVQSEIGTSVWYDTVAI